MQSWRQHNTPFWEQAPFFRLLVPLIAGIIAYEFSLFSLSIKLGFLFLAVSVGILCLSIVRARSAGTQQILRFPAIQLVLVLAGYLSYALHDIRNHSAWFGHHLNAESYLVALADDPVEREKTWRLDVQVLKAISKDSVRLVKGKARIYLYKSSEYKPKFRMGDQLLVPSGWQPIRNAGNPHEFDYTSFSRRQNLHYQQFLSPDELSLFSASTPRKPASFITQCHQWCMNQLARHITDNKTLGLVQSMLVGDRENLDEEIQQQYTDTGIVHIIAISGSHVGVFFLIVSACLFWRRRQNDPLKYLLAIPLLWLYVLIAGAPVSAIRAALMFSMLAVGFSLDKDHNALNTLFATAFFMLLLQPSWLSSVGFQLSFVAVLSLILFFTRIRKLCTPKYWLLRKVWDVLAASLAAEILVAPLVIYYFHLFPLTFLVANALAFFYMFLVLLGGLLIIAFTNLAAVATFLASVLTWVTTRFNSFIAFLQDLNPESFKHIYLSTAGLTVVYLIIASLAIWLYHRQVKGLITALAGIAFLLTLHLQRQYQVLQNNSLIVYNVNKITHAELLKGENFSIITTDTSATASKPIAYATREAHIATGAWQPGNPPSSDILSVDGSTLIVLNQPIRPDSTTFPVDYLLLNYPVKDYHAPQLRQVFGFEKLILTGKQPRYILNHWRDSCLRDSIPTHITSFDGAFILK